MLKPTDIGLLIIRISTGGLMLFHGVKKLFVSLQGIKAMLANHGLPEIIAFGVYLGEIVAPLMILFGFLTRIGGALLSINMLAAIWLAHGQEFFSIDSHGAWALELQGLFLSSALALIFTGGGKYAVSTKRFGD